MDSFNGSVGVPAGRFFVFIDGDDEVDLFARDFFTDTDLVSSTINDDDGDSCFTAGLTSISNTNPESMKLNQNHKKCS